MKTVLWKDVSSYKVVTGFGKESIDPVLTGKKIKDTVEGLSEHKDNLVYSSKLLTEKNKEKKEGIIESINKNNEIIKKKIADKYNEIVVFFSVKNGEEKISDDKYITLKSLFSECKNDGELLLTDGTKIVNLKNKRYFVREDNIIIEKTIKNIGEEYPEDSILVLTDLDRISFEKSEKIKRISLMSQDAKANSFKLEKHEILKDVVLKITELELTGVSEVDAKKKAFDEYKLDIAKVELEYGL